MFSCSWELGRALHVKPINLILLLMTFKLFFLSVGAIGGHDPLDSTTVTDPFEAFTLPDEISVKDLHIGIPKVSICICLREMLSHIFCLKAVP